MTYLYLFISFLKIGAFSFGGGYAALPLIQMEVVSNHHWLSMSEFTNLITISQMTPGPIAINSATFVGTKIAGVQGAIIATIGCVLPSILLVTLLAYIYLKYRQLSFLQSILAYLRPTVIALIFVSGVSICISSFFPNGKIIVSSLCIFLFALGLLIKYKKDPIFVMVICGLINVGLYAFNII